MKIRTITRTFFFASLLSFLGAAGSTAMAGQLSVLLGQGSYTQHNLTVGYQTTPIWSKKMETAALDLTLEYSLGVIQAANHQDNRYTWHVGLTPIVQWWFVPNNALEVGIGATFFSRTYVGEEHFATAFQFGDYLGVLHRFSGTPWTIGLRVAHYSNGGIRNPNPGMTYALLRVSRAFQ